MGALTILFWGVSLPATKVLLINGFTPNLITFLRFFFATFFLVVLVPSSRKQKIAKEDRIQFYLMGLGGTTLFFFLENSALKYTTVANTALITATIPLFTLLTAAIFLGKRIHWKNIIAIPMGLFGTFLLFYQGLRVSSFHFKGDLLVLGSVLMWVIYSFAYHKIKDKYNSLQIVYRTLFYGWIFTLPLLLPEIKSFPGIDLNHQVGLALFFLAFCCSFLAYLMWTLTLKNIGIMVTSNFILFIPIISIISARIFLSEAMSKMTYLASALILFSAYLNSHSKDEHHF